MGSKCEKKRFGEENKNSCGHFQSPCPSFPTRLGDSFRTDAMLTKFKDLSQPGQYACQEKVTIGRAERVIENVRVLGPTRKNTQVEISVSDCFKLGIQAPIRDSGDLAGSAGLTLVGPAGSVTVPEGAIIAARHIHMHPKDAEYFGVKDGDRINVECTGPRGVVFCSAGPCQ